MKLGVLVNRAAGGGRAADAAAALAAGLAGHEVWSVRGFGAELAACQVALEAPDAALGYVARVQAAARSLAAQAPDRLVLVGGDGFAAYVADALLTAGLPVPPLIGVAGGTANVGPIIALEALPALDTLSFQPVGALEVLDDGGHIAYAFNDLVLGDTYLTTIDGRTVTASAEALWRDGRTEPRQAARHIGDVTVGVNGRQTRTRLPRVAQAVASTLERDRLYGRAVTGLLCFSPQSPYQAALLLSERGIVSMEDSPLGFSAPALFEQLLFTAADTVTVSGLADGISAIVDGNPYPRRGDIRLRYHERLLLAAEKKGETPWKR